jgi:hypothetical protein
MADAPEGKLLEDLCREGRACRAEILVQIEVKSVFTSHESLWFFLNHGQNRFHQAFELGLMLRGENKSELWESIGKATALLWSQIQLHRVEVVKGRQVRTVVSD